MKALGFSELEIRQAASGFGGWKGIGPLFHAMGTMWVSTKFKKLQGRISCRNAQCSTARVTKIFTMNYGATRFKFRDANANA